MLRRIVFLAIFFFLPLSEVEAKCVAPKKNEVACVEKQKLPDLTKPAPVGVDTMPTPIVRLPLKSGS